MSKNDKEMMDSKDNLKRHKEVTNPITSFMFPKNESASSSQLQLPKKNVIDNLREDTQLSPTCLSTLTFTPYCRHHLTCS